MVHKGDAMEGQKNSNLHIRIGEDTLSQIKKLEQVFHQNHSEIIRNLIKVAANSLRNVATEETEAQRKVP